MRRIMLVDNETAILNGLTHCMDWEAHGYRIAAAARDGLEAVRILERNPPDIVISDIRMPGMDGLALAEWILAHTPRVKVILLTGFPDFDYAKQAINFRVVDFVLKPSTEEKLLRALQKASALLEEESDQQKTLEQLEAQTRQSLRYRQNLLLYDLIYHANVSAVFTCNRIAELGLDLFSYFVLRFGVVSRAADSDYTLYVQQAQELVGACLPDWPLYFVPKAERFCYAVLCAPADAPVEALCTRAAERAGEQSEFLLTVGLSPHQTDPLAMHAAALQADEAQQFAEYFLQLPVMRFDAMPTMTREAWNGVADDLKLLESALERQNRACVEETYTHLFETVRTQKLPIASVQRICSIIQNFCIGILFSYDMADALPEQTLRAVEASYEHSAVDAMERALRSLVTEVLDCISANPANIDSIIFSIKRYVDQNYAEELSLEQLAAQVHLSPSYLSKLFKREIGKNLSVYILGVRMEHAKLLLRSTDLKTYEIAEAVGVSDPVYFSKLFKKVVGCKPKEYRAGDPGGKEG